MGLILSALKRVYPENCVETLLVDLDILNLECLKIVASKTVGYAIIVASVLVKVSSFIYQHAANRVFSTQWIPVTTSKSILSRPASISQSGYLYVTAS